MTRERAIELIGSMKGDLCDFYDDNDLTALEMAIASLKTDEAYQLEYENRDFVEIPEGMKNWEVMNLVLRKAFPHTTFIRRSDECNKTRSIVYAIEWEDEPYKVETCKGCLEPCIMYEPDMRACKKKVTER